MSCNKLHPRTNREIVDVSIPIGFSNELQRRRVPPPVSGPAVFQSLSGFPMSCNHYPACFPPPPRSVSIPIGFSNELQLCVRISQDLVVISFNPYRVFQ